MVEAGSDFDSWLYVDSTSGSQKGPVPGRVLLKLVEKGIVNNTLIWKSGMEKWLPMHEVEYFANVLKFQTKQWYYLDSENNQKGPIFSRLLLHKVKEGDIDGLTLVYNGDLGGWKKIAEVPELKDAIQKATEEEEAREAALKNAENNIIPTENQIYNPDATNPAEELMFEPTEVGQKDAKKSFIADDGSRYRWDDDEQDWVFDNDEGEDQPVLDEEDSEYGDSRYRKRKADANDDDEELSEPEDHENAILMKNEEKHAHLGSEENKDGVQEVKPKKKRSKKKKNKVPNTWVYVTGLPHDVTTEEIKDHFSKVGLIAISPYDQQPRIKIYYEEDGQRCKGDCSICYNAEESVKLALDILHEGYIRPKYKITVARATFENHATNKDESAKQPSNARKPSTFSQAQAKVARNAAKQALAWNEDDDSGVSTSALKIIVLEGMFQLKEVADPAFADELERDIASECEKFGPLEKITLFSKNPRGIVVVKFSTSYAAQECIQVMNGRFFGGRKIKSFYWDGVTNYSVVPLNVDQEDEEEKIEKARLDEFGDWLDQEQEELPEEFQLRTE